MVAITATNRTTPSVQTSLARTRVEQARREADQAEANAKNLRAQADEAEQQAQTSQNNLRKVSTQVQQQDATYRKPQRDSASEVPVKVQKLIEQMYAATSSSYAQAGNPLKASALSKPVLNTQGQATGRIVNIST